MTQTNFIENICHDDPSTPLLCKEAISNSDIIADMAASPENAASHVNSSEIDIGAGYTIKLESKEKVLHRHGVECAPPTSTDEVVNDICQYRGSFVTKRIGQTISKNYGLLMSPEHSIQFFKRVSHSSNGNADD